MALIINAKTVFPKFKYSQDQLTDFLATIWPENKEMIMKFGKNVQVKERSLCIPIEQVLKLDGFANRNDLWRDKALELTAESIQKLFIDSPLPLNEVDMFITTSVTGFSIPSLDTLLMNKLGMNPTLKRLPLFGFGCLGGVASLNRAYEYLESNPTKTVLVTAVELCSLTYQVADKDPANLVGSSLFGDGAASVLLVGKEHPLAASAKIKIEDYKAFFYPNTQSTMGWNIKDTGFQLLLDNNVSEIVEENIPKNLAALLDTHGIHQEDIKFTVSHPGGPKVLLSMQKALEASDSFFSHSWESLSEHGNMSSVSVLNVLERELTHPTSGKDDHGLMLAMGPGFNSEITLIKRVA